MLNFPGGRSTQLLDLRFKDEKKDLSITEVKQGVDKLKIDEVGMKNITFCFWITFALFIFSNPLGATQVIQLSPALGEFKFPFFESKTPVWQYNGQIPGPILRAPEGSTLEILLHNRLSEPTSIHWHGLRVANEMDGVPGVTQDPVAPGDQFTYRLHLPDAGTFWYHPHFNNSEQIERGLKGVLIVDERIKQPWSRELIWLIDDWRLQRDGKIFPHFNTHHDLMHDGRWGNVVTVNGINMPEFTVHPGERIRLRMINGANARVFLPRFSGLEATVIAVDGRPVSKTFTYDDFMVSPGNRIELDITIPPDAGGERFIIEDHFPRRAYSIATIVVSDSKALSPPQFEPPTAAGFIPEELFIDAPTIKTWDLNAFRGGELGISWGMNTKFWPDADKAKLLLGKPQKIVFKNSSSRLHPMHIHGVFFRVLERNGKPAVEPFTRDTVLIAPRESVTIGFVPQHDGIWATHCHILEHAEAGMMTTINVTEHLKSAPNKKPGP